MPVDLRAAAEDDAVELLREAVPGVELAAQVDPSAGRSLHFVFRIGGHFQLALELSNRPGTDQMSQVRRWLGVEAVALHGGDFAVADFDVDDARLGASDFEVDVVTLGPLLLPKFFGGVECSARSVRVAAR